MTAPSTGVCACGCGGATRGNWVPGHDSIALSTRIKSGWGSTAGFIRWFDESAPTSGTEPRPQPDKESE